MGHTNNWTSTCWYGYLMMRTIIWSCCLKTCSMYAIFDFKHTHVIYQTVGVSFNPFIVLYDNEHFTVKPLSRLTWLYFHMPFVWGKHRLTIISLFNGMEIPSHLSISPHITLNRSCQHTVLQWSLFCRVLHLTVNYIIVLSTFVSIIHDCFLTERTHDWRVLEYNISVCVNNAWLFPYWTDTSWKNALLQYERVRH